MLGDRKLGRRAALLSVLLVMGTLAACAPGSGSSGTLIYDANPHPTPPGVSSQGFQCCQVAEFGDMVHLAGTARTLTQASVTMANWAIHSTPANQSFGDATGWDQPLTLNIYKVGPNDGSGNPTAGALLASTTQVFHIPWRPEPDAVNCPTKDNPGYEYKWQAVAGAPDTNCYNSLATVVTFQLGQLNLTVPDDIVWGVAYDTQSYGEHPLGVDGPYNSLNVGAKGTAPAIGSRGNSNQVWIRGGNYPYCDHGAGGTGIFRPDVGCAANTWTALMPEICFTAIDTP
jgi:hypothetical protein